MLENGKQYAIVKPKVKPLLHKAEPCGFLGAVERTNEDHWIYRTAIRRSGYWVARYNGHYHQIMGGIRTPFFLSEIKCGKY